MDRGPVRRPQPQHSPRVFALFGALVLSSMPFSGLAQVDPVCGLKAAAVLGGDSNPHLEQHASLRSVIDAQLASDHFVETFAAFVNTRFNRGLAMTAEEDAVYYVVRHVLSNRLPWSQVYLGEFGWSGPTGYPKIDPDPAGVGYFTAPSWIRRYAGNDLDGYMLFAAYRVIHNTTGVVLVPSPFNADANSNLAGRQRPECRGCHLDSAVPLDPVARFFPRRSGFGDRMVLTPAENTPAQIAGRPVASLRELLQVLLATDDYRFFTCRMVFEYTYGRPESTCEALVFDRCVDALVATDDIRAAITAVVDDPAFCGGGR